MTRLPDTTECPRCGGSKSEWQDVCFPCRVIAQDEKEREEVLR